MSSMLILAYRYCTSPMFYVLNYKWQMTISYCYISNGNLAARLLALIQLRTQLGPGKVLFI